MRRTYLLHATKTANKNRYRTAPVSLLVASLALGGCVPDKGPKDDMGAGPDLAVAMPDMAIERPDLSGGGPDLSTGKPDLAGGSGDMAGGTGDMAGGRDMSSPGDLSMPPRDMAGGPMVTGLPTCTTTGVTADMLFADVAKASCANGRCHAGGDGGLTFTSGATLKSSMVGVASKQTLVVPLVTAGNVDQSYLMYKLVNQQATVMGRGGIMPRGGMRLPDADLCKFIVWIKEGAK